MLKVSELGKRLSCATWTWTVIDLGCWSVVLLHPPFWNPFLVQEAARGRVGLPHFMGIVLITSSRLKGRAEEVTPVERYLSGYLQYV